MVEKPTEGICSRCNSEDLEFYDDGSGRCLDCGRTFRWASQEEISQQKSQPQSQQPQQPQPTQQQRRQPQQQPQQMQQQYQQPQQTQPTTPQATGFTPSNQPSGKPKKPSRGFLWITIAGLATMMIGYVILSVTMMGLELEGDVVTLLRGLYYLLSSVGVLVAGTGLVFGGAVAEYLDDKVRTGMFISAVILITLYLGGIMGPLMGA